MKSISLLAAAALALGTAAFVGCEDTTAPAPDTTTTPPVDTTTTPPADTTTPPPATAPSGTDAPAAPAAP